MRIIYFLLLLPICLNDNEYRYGFLLNRDKITEEWLYEKKYLSGQFGAKEILIYV